MDRFWDPWFADQLHLAVDRPFSYDSPPPRVLTKSTEPDRLAVLDFEIPKFTRRCAASGREFQPGERFHSVLVSQGSDVVRLDYSVEAWEGPPPEALGTWVSEVPDPKARQVGWAPNDVMLHYFLQLQEQDPDEDTKALSYVLTLLMIRRRIFKLDTTEQDDQGREVLIVFCPRNENEYRVLVEVPDAQQVAVIQEELAQLLFA